MPDKRLSSHAYISLSECDQAIAFTFNSKVIKARSDDTIASALHAAGIGILSRSFKYHRPRGLYDGYGLGADLLLAVDGTPNVRGDKTRVEDGMDVRSQNAWPSPDFDAMAVNNTLVPLLPNGFYYKMFHRPKWLWPIAEKFIRKAAGIGAIDTTGETVDTRYEKRYRFPDICVIGGGPAGLASCLAACQEGKHVLLVEEDPQLGGHSVHTATKVANCQDDRLNGLSEQDAAGAIWDELKTYKNLEILTSTVVFALYEDNLIAAQSKHDLYKIRAGAVILAPGATDRHLVFENNDIPGIMTGRGVERLITMHGVKPGTRAVVIGNHDGVYHTAMLLQGAGVEVLVVADSRSDAATTEAARIVNENGTPIQPLSTIHAAKGRKSVNGAVIGDIAGKVEHASYRCDLIVIAAGFKPQLSLLSMGRVQPGWDEERQVFRVEKLPDGLYSTGDVHGTASFAQLYKEGKAVGLAAAQGAEQPQSVRSKEDIIVALPADIPAKGKHHFICKCMDVTRAEACASIAEGFDRVETLKRYTSMGMGPCQGKMCYEAVARLAAEDTGLSTSVAVPTTVRPPYIPVSFGVLAGRSQHLIPIRRTAMHDMHQQAGATFLNAGQWKRPHSYGDVQREARSMREGLGIIDVSTLGKLGISGPDAIDFLQFMLPGKFRKLATGKIRYSAMIGEDGILFEDGTLAHVKEGYYYMSTTTGNQDAIRSLFWWWIVTTDFDVKIDNLGPIFAAVNISGKNSRKLLEKLVDIDMSTEGFPYMSTRNATINGVPVMLFRIGFTGELSYEIHFPSEYGEAMWTHIMAEGAEYSIKPFGIETQRILRLEKGHLLPGIDTDALTNPYEAGVGFTIKDNKDDFIGKAFLKNFKDRGIENKLIPYKLSAGDAIPSDGVAILKAGKITGRVTSSRMSPILGYGIGLAWVNVDQSTPGTKIAIRLAGGGDVIGEVLDHAAYDPEGVLLKS
ncbi:MAG: FAD-dependent oxidoreductase [Kiritimatiellae bacterium]|nr:FAD-dependent oxidoreductase [Kiritimatiellia bacterium]